MIFISYSHKDKQVVAPIAEAIRKAFGDDHVFFDLWSIQPGDSIIEKVNKGLTACRYFFFFVSKNSLSSEMAALEWRNALLKFASGDIKFIPVKIDDCPMPTIFTQNLYINLYGYGLDMAIRQIIDVASGKNTYSPGQMGGFQNIRAYISGTNQNMTIEFRAEAYTEPHSKYLILIMNDENQLSWKAKNTSLFLQGFQPNVILSDGSKCNAISISKSEATSPRFPFVVVLSAKGENSIKFIGAMRAVSADSFTNIPVNYLNEI